MPRQKAKVLDVETEDERQARLQLLLEQLDSRSAPESQPLPGHTTPLQSAFPQPNTTASIQDLPIGPPGDLLQRVQAFLPQIEASNASLSTADPRSVDIEEVGSDEERYIQMDLGLGVYEQRRRARRASSSSCSSCSSLSSSTSSSSASSSSSSASSSSSTSSTTNPAPEFLRASRPVRPLPQRARPDISVISSSTTNDNSTVPTQAASSLSSNVQP